MKWRTSWASKHKWISFRIWRKIRVACVHWNVTSRQCGELCSPTARGGRRARAKVAKGRGGGGEKERERASERNQIESCEWHSTSFLVHWYSSNFITLPKCEPDSEHKIVRRRDGPSSAVSCQFYCKAFRRQSALRWTALSKNASDKVRETRR